MCGRGGWDKAYARTGSVESLGMIVDRPQNIQVCRRSRDERVNWSTCARKGLLRGWGQLESDSIQRHRNTLMMTSLKENVSSSHHRTEQAST